MDLDAVDQKELDRQMEALDQIQRATRHQPLVVDANRYAASVDKWFQRHADLFEEKQSELESLAEMEIESRDPEAEAISLSDACDVVRWYRIDCGQAHPPDFSSREECELLDVEAMRQDVLGSAKVALLGIDRSLAAWTVIRQAFSEQADELLEMLLALDRLRRAAEAQFPDARGFVRTGPGRVRHGIGKRYNDIAMPRFVILRHETRKVSISISLLEAGGVLKTWSLAEPPAVGVKSSAGSWPTIAWPTSIMKARSPAAAAR